MVESLLASVVVVDDDVPSVVALLALLVVELLLLLLLVVVVVVVPLLLLVPVVPAASAARTVAVSCRTSSRTRRISAGNVLASPVRRSVSACVCTAEGQFDGCASRLWRSCSWILGGRRQVMSAIYVYVLDT